MSGNKTKLIYIGGHGRSGSTLLERMLAQVDDFVAVGELRHIWDKTFAENQLCGCNRPFNACPFWNAVLDEAFGGYDQVPIDHIRSLKWSVDRVRYLPHMLLPYTVQAFQQRVDEYCHILSNLYAAIRNVSGKSVIVDSSKDPSTPYILRTLPELELYMLHLVRDSRAVGFSWQRKKARPEIVAKKTYMRTYSPRETAVGWFYRNLLIQFVQYMQTPYTLVRYEDLVAQPEQTLWAILEAVGQPDQTFDFIEDGEVFLEMSHTVAGNPFRFKQGKLALRLDSEWKHKMKRKDKLLMTFLNFPLLYKYGYVFSPN